MFVLNRVFRFAPDDGAGSGGEGDDQALREIREKLQRLIDREGGDAGAVALQLYNDNFQLRERNRQLRERVPAEGSVVLTAEQAALWQAYQQLGTPKDIEQAIKDRDQAQGDLARMQRSAMIREAAETMGYKASVLEALDAQMGSALSYEVRDVEVDGGKKRVAFVKAGDAEAVPLDNYAEQRWADFLPALQATGQKPGTPYPPQQAGGKKTKEVDLVEKFLQEQEEARKKVRNPLLPDSEGE